MRTEKVAFNVPVDILASLKDMKDKKRQKSDKKATKRRQKGNRFIYLFYESAKGNYDHISVGKSLNAWIADVIRHTDDVFTH